MFHREVEGGWCGVGAPIRPSWAGCLTAGKSVWPIAWYASSDLGCQSFFFLMLIERKGEWLSPQPCVVVHSYLRTGVSNLSCRIMHVLSRPHSLGLMQLMRCQCGGISQNADALDAFFSRDGLLVDG